jgi:hypothetical protein
LEEDDDECISFKWNDDYKCADLQEHCDNKEFGEQLRDCCPTTCNADEILCEDMDECLSTAWDDPDAKCSWYESMCELGDEDQIKTMRSCCPGTCDLCEEKTLRNDDDYCLESRWGDGYKCDWNSEYCNDVDFMEVMNDCCPCECGIEGSCATAHEQADKDSDSCI